MPVSYGKGWEELSKKQAPPGNTGQWNHIPPVDITGSEMDNIRAARQSFENLPSGSQTAQPPQSNGGFPMLLLSPNFKKLLDIPDA